MQKKIQPRTFSEEKIKKHFSDASVFYDMWAKATESKASKRVLELAGISRSDTVLEVGVGTGLLFEKLLEKNAHGFTAGIDISPQMLAKAKSRTSKLTDARDFSLQQASVYQLPFKEQQFDCLICCYVLDLLPATDFVDIFTTFRRLLKQGGRLVLASMTFGWKWYHLFWGWMARTVPDLMTGCRPVDLELFIKQAGLRIEKSEKVSQHTFPSQIIKAVNNKF